MLNHILSFHTALLIWLLIAHPAQSSWVGGDGSWTDPAADNWGLGVGAYPGDSNNSGVGVTISSGSTVTLDTDLVNPVGVWNAGTFTLNLSASLTIGAAYHGNWNSFTINQTAGTLTSNSRFDMGGATGSGGSTYQSYYNLSGGRLDLNSHDFRLGYSNAGDGNRTYLNLSGSGILDFVNANVGRADLRISGGTLTGSGLFNMNHTAYSPLLWIDGSSALSISFGSMNAYNGGSATIRYTMDASGVTAMDVGTLNLNSGANVSMLEVDMTNWDGVSGLNNGHIILANYTTLNGTFSSVNVTGGSGTVVYDYDAGNGETAIALYVVPEPGTLLLTGVGLMCCGMARRKKRR